MLILSCQKWMVNYFKQKSFLLPRNVLLVRQFLASVTKKTTNCHSTPINQIQPKTIFTEACKKTEEKEWADKIISFVFSILFSLSICMCFFLFIGLDCYKAGTKLDKSECLKANGQEIVPPQFEKCTIECKR